jgi:acyl-lipid omega-6 desaturase (Delta-12 desaturase)
VNGKHRDSWVPYTKAQFDSLPRLHRWRERLYRAPWGIGLAPYYIVERWWQVKLFPRHFVPARFRASAWRHFALLMAWLGSFLGLLALAPLYSPTGSLTALLLGFALPFYIWQTLFSFTVYVQHTHPLIPWFDGPVDRRVLMPQEALALHLVFPQWFRIIGHNVFEHPAHHVNPRITFHRLEEAQATLNGIAADRAVVQRFSVGWLNDTLRRCKLYDYGTHAWLDFDGRPTAQPALTVQERAAVRTTPGTMLPAALT